MKVLYGRRTPGVAQRLADELGEPVMFWPHSTFARGQVVNPRSKRRKRKRRGRAQKRS
jgi:hypothetical protein